MIILILMGFFSGLQYIYYKYFGISYKNNLSLAKIESWFEFTCVNIILCPREKFDETHIYLHAYWYSLISPKR